MSDDCMGPVADWKKLRFGQCRECFDENWCHATHRYFDGRQTMVGRVCRHRFIPVKYKPKAHKVNAYNNTARLLQADDPMALEALLPEYCQDWDKFPPEPSITCPDCGARSYHPEDIAQKYCGRCHKFQEENDNDSR